jgi:hypothetical protein
MRSLIVCLLLLGGCGESTGIPQPDPIPKVSLIRTTHVAADSEVDLVGLPGSVAGQGTVSLESSLARVTGPATASGTFALTLKALAGEPVKVRFRESEAVSVVVPGIPPPGGPIPPGPIAGVPPVSAAGAGRVLVQGQSGSTPGGPVLGINAALGEVVTTTSGAADGRFGFEIAASPGQRLAIYDDDGTPLENPWHLDVP